MNLFLLRVYLWNSSFFYIHQTFIIKNILRNCSWYDSKIKSEYKMLSYSTSRNSILCIIILDPRHFDTYSSMFIKNTKT